MSKIIIYAGMLSLALIFSCKSTKVQDLPPEQFTTNPEGIGPVISIEFERGEAHNHPLMAIWVEDMNGNYIQTLYVAESIANGVFGHGDASAGVWLPGEIRRPAALPVWSHKRGIKAEDGLYVPDLLSQVPDAYTGATPWGDFIMQTRLDEDIQGKFKVFFEINQSWDWNEYWTNNKYPDNDEYKTSCQPALVYEATIDPASGKKVYPMKVIGHSHYAGEDGNVYDDLSTMTTALKIAKMITVKLN